MTAFVDRQDAGARLADVLAALPRSSAAVVLGIPRGGVPVAAPIARRLGAELGVVVARKMGAPGQPELAIGATTAGGATFVDRRSAGLTGADEEYLARERERQIAEARRREAAFGAKPALANRDVVVVDDGLATGATALAAVRSVRAAGARSVTLAVPVASARSAAVLRREVDDLLCLIEDPDFECVAAYYEDFAPVGDEEVLALLHAGTARGL